MVSIDLVDLSHWQDGHLGFAKLRDSGTRGVYHKATEGTGFTDAGFATRRVQVGRTKGMRFGAYHFANATNDAAAQAARFLAVASPKPGDLRPMLDLEEAAFGSWSVKRRTEWVREWVDAVKAATGVPPVIYTHFNLNHHFDCPLWVARYSNAMSAPTVPKPWATWSIWQFSNGVFGRPNSAPGVGHVDLNTFNSGITLDVLTIPAKHKPAPKPAPAPAHTLPPVDEQAARNIEIGRSPKETRRPKVRDRLRALIRSLRRKK